VNVLRPFPGLGVQVWGARTLSTDLWLQFVSVRRGLSAIERRAKLALDAVVFEPNTPVLWLQVVRQLVGVLQPVFDAGALHGATPAQSFYVRCDAALNPPEQVADGQLLCEVGVALAASAEFLVFRVGRLQGVVEVVE
jgi:phage tail sheath protein FI